MTKYSSQGVADELGIHKRTLMQWLYDGKIPEPQRIEQPGVVYRLWTEKDLERVRQYKEAHYRKGRGRKPQPK
jgi:DNA-binding transcriptional MerR regulator